MVGGKESGGDPQRAAMAGRRSLLAARPQRVLLSLGLLRPKAVYKVLDFAESKGVEVRREPVWTWTGQAKAER
jgi:predicted nicotinamide N-methyase